MVGLVDAVSTAVLPGAHPINIAPSLRHIPKWLPGGGFHSVAKACKENTEKLCEMMVGFSRRQADSVSDNERDSEDGGKVHANREAVALAPRQPMVVQWLKIIEGEQVQNGENQLKSLGSDQGTLKDTGLTAFAAGYDTVRSLLISLYSNLYRLGVCTLVDFYIPLLVHNRNGQVPPYSKESSRVPSGGVKLQK